MSNERFASVWDAIEDTPAEAENMKLRSALMMALKEHIARTGLSQSQAAKLFGVTQPRAPTSCAARSASSVWMPWSTWRQRLACMSKCACWKPRRTGAFWTGRRPTQAGRRRADTGRERRW